MMSLMSKCCSASNFGMISAPVGSPWNLPSPPPWHFSALTMQATGRSFLILSDINMAENDIDIDVLSELSADERGPTRRWNGVRGEMPIAIQ
jgi:hypothetical protein